MPQPAREVALEVINRVHRTQAFANLILPKKLRESGLSRRDRPLLTELAYGTLRAEGTLDWIIKQYTTRPLNKIPDLALDLLRLATYQIVYLQGIPDRAAVDEAVESAKRHFHTGLVSFVNGVLRTIAREKDNFPWPDRAKDPIKYISLKLWHPGWLVKMWVKELGLVETEALCEANNRPPKVNIRTNTLLTAPPKLSDALERSGWKIAPGRYLAEALVVSEGGDVTETPEHEKGHFYVQNEGSMIVSHVVAPKANDTVLDSCAGPGGKATHLAELLKNNGQVIAVDVNPKRLQLVKQAARRMGIKIIVPIEADATQLKGVMKDLVDEVLVDAPCSGLGVLARRPDARWQKKPAQLEELAELQGRLLDAAAPYVKPDGALIYSVCTIGRLESYDVIDRFLTGHPDFKPDDLKQFLPQALCGYAGEGTIQLLPHRDGTDGLFIARLIRAR